VTDGPMSELPPYHEKYAHVVFERVEGILLVRMHSEGGPLRWGLSSHDEFTTLFRDIADDRENHVIILTGTGDEFIGPVAAGGDRPGALLAAQAGTESRPSKGGLTPAQQDHFRTGAITMLSDLLRIDVPIICAVNGPAVRHAELATLSDIVLASATATFQDSAHFINSMPPGDGQHVIMPLAIGLNRARYYLLTGQSISATEALVCGLVNEVLPPDKLLERAWELAHALNRHSVLHLRATRRIITKQLRRAMEDLLEYGIDLEGSVLVDL
jgi:enoyl-CoA hydratase/carnithine racemase